MAIPERQLNKLWERITRRKVCVLIILVSVIIIFSLLCPLRLKRILHNVSVKITEISDQKYPTKPGFKKILLWTPAWNLPLWRFEEEGQHFFTKYGCPETRCIVTPDQTQLSSSDLVLFHAPDLDAGWDTPMRRHSKQLWVLHMLESPSTIFWKRCKFSVVTDYFDSSVDSMFHATMTYHQNSQIYHPYGQAMKKPVSDNVTRVNYAEDRTKSAFIFVSNCRTSGTKWREQYIKELRKFIDVDVFGKCGKTDPCHSLPDGASCYHNMWTRYRFYLSFENSQCDHYITEKFWNALAQKVLPVALGAPLDHYLKIAPPNSFLHVDNFSSPEHLARHMHYLESNEKAYNTYFDWMKSYSLQTDRFMVDAFCGVCSLAHKNDQEYPLIKISEWWNKDNQCHGRTDLPEID